MGTCKRTGEAPPRLDLHFHSRDHLVHGASRRYFVYTEPSCFLQASHLSNNSLHQGEPTTPERTTHCGKLHGSDRTLRCRLGRLRLHTPSLSRTTRQVRNCWNT